MAISSPNANNCFSIGDIGDNSGGIYQNGSSSTATNCYSIGDIKNGAGGIFGATSSNSIALNCYSHGNIADNAGGIFGSNSSQMTTTNCYSIGITGANAGGISGNQCDNAIFTNCYVLGNNIYGSFDGTNTGSNCYVEQGIWNDNNALTTITNNSTEWVVIGENIPFLLSSFTNCRFTCPIGYQYFYYLNNTTTITESGTTILVYVNGFYKSEQNSITSGLYGYNIINKTITVNIESGMPSFFISLIDKQINFNPEWFD